MPFLLTALLFSGECTNVSFKLGIISSCALPFIGD